MNGVGSNVEDRLTVNLKGTGAIEGYGDLLSFDNVSKLCML